MSIALIALTLNFVCVGFGMEERNNMHGLSVLARCKPFHKIMKGKTICGSIIKTNIDVNDQGWSDLPEDRCKRCIKIYEHLLQMHLGQ